jgi:hypothetical protein
MNDARPGAHPRSRASAGASGPQRRPPSPVRRENSRCRCAGQPSRCPARKATGRCRGSAPKHLRRRTTPSRWPRWCCTRRPEKPPPLPSRRRRRCTPPPSGPCTSLRRGDRKAQAECRIQCPKAHNWCRQRMFRLAVWEDLTLQGVVVVRRGRRRRPRRRRRRRHRRRGGRGVWLQRRRRRRRGARRGRRRGARRRRRRGVRRGRRRRRGARRRRRRRRARGCDRARRRVAARAVARGRRRHEGGSHAERSAGRGARVGPRRRVGHGATARHIWRCRAQRVDRHGGALDAGCALAGERNLRLGPALACEWGNNTKV